MLPFLDKKRMSASIISARKGRQDAEVHSEIEAPGEAPSYYKQCAEDILAAVEHKSPIALAKALEELAEKIESKEGSEGGYE